MQNFGRALRNCGGRGKSKRSANCKSVAASSIVADLAQTISPHDEMVGLGYVQAGVTKRISELLFVTPSFSMPDLASSSLGPCIEPPVHLLAEQQRKNEILTSLLSEGD